MKQVNRLLEYIQRRKGEGVTGVCVVASFVNRQVHPIKERVHSASEFSGVGDPTRESDAEWTTEAFTERLRSLFTSDMVLSTEGCPLPFSLQMPADEVLIRVLYFHCTCCPFE